MDGFEVKSETERFTVVCPCCRHGREMYKNAWRTCSTIILVLLTNNITSFCHCHCRSLRQMTGCGLTQLHIFQWSSQGGPGVPVTRPTPLYGSQTISVRLEQRNLCHLQLASCTIDLRRPWTRAFFSAHFTDRWFQAEFTRKRFHIDTIPWLRNRVKIDAVWKCLHETVFARKSKSWCYKYVLHYFLNWTMQILHQNSNRYVFKSMRFYCLHDRWNCIVLETLHFWHFSTRFRQQFRSMLCKQKMY